MHLKKLNRIRSSQATKQKFWCNNCDGALVGEYGKCPACGKKSSDKRKS